jgi:hypothetical protein
VPSARRDEVLDVPYFHVVFTIPAILNVLARSATLSAVLQGNHASHRAPGLAVVRAISSNFV